MTPEQVRMRRIELGLTIEELAWALDMDETDLRRIESGDNALSRSRLFEDAFDRFEERVFGTFVGA